MPKAADDETRVYYFKLIGDYYRYMVSSAAMQLFTPTAALGRGHYVHRARR